MKFQGVILFCLRMAQIAGIIIPPSESLQRRKDLWEIASSTYCPKEQFCKKCSFFLKEDTFFIQETVVGSFKAIFARNDAKSEIYVAFRGTDAKHLKNFLLNALHDIDSI
jgi:hypothetical protein